jgi:Family of unknown function (DUF5994)
MPFSGELVASPRSEYCGATEDTSRGDVKVSVAPGARRQRPRMRPRQAPAVSSDSRFALSQAPDARSVDAPAQPARLSRWTAADSASYDGAWWPRSGKLEWELPDLLAALGDRVAPVTRVSFAAASWGPTPRAMRIGGRRVHLGGYRAIDPHLITMTGAGGDDRISLLVVPSDTDDATAARRMLHPQRASSEPVGAAQLAWEDEGGRVVRDEA